MHLSNLPFKSRFSSQTAWPKISIVMPSFNQAQFIQRSLDSILEQEYPNTEIIVVDGGSTDDTTSILKSYENSIAFWESTEDDGQSDALNKGFSRASGEIFGWLNSDDLYLPNAFCLAVAAFERNRFASVVFGDYLTIDAEDKVTDYRYSFDFSLRHFIYEGFTLNSQAMFWTRDAHRRFGEFDTSLHRTMDYDLIARLGINETNRRFLRINDTPLGCFRRYYGQKTGMAIEGVVDDIVTREHQRIAQKLGYGNKFKATGKFLRVLYRLRRAYWYCKRGGVSYSIRKLIGYHP